MRVREKLIETIRATGVAVKKARKSSQLLQQQTGSVKVDIGVVLERWRRKRFWIFKTRLGVALAAAGNLLGLKKSQIKELTNGEENDKENDEVNHEEKMVKKMVKKINKKIPKKMMKKMM
ncbi:hypothetical protein B566_EDAN000659 [Ephemera danica]|nr:hypothetical protein B566_EDAN000659 [Ephemera danica]